MNKFIKINHVSDYRKRQSFQSHDEQSLEQIDTEKWLYTRNQTAIIFSVSLVCLWHWRNRNILVPIKCGGKVYYTRNSILELINQNNI